MKRAPFLALVAAPIAMCLTVALAQTQTAPASSPASRPATGKPLDRAALERQFKSALTDVTLAGSWRMHRGDGPVDKPSLGEPRPEAYQIVSADHEKDDFWIIRARIQFEQNDVTLPVRVRVVWAEDTPIITVDEVNIPGIGVYSARVMIYRGYYCGAWFGKGYGGVMSGEIVKTPPESDTPREAPKNP